MITVEKSIEEAIKLKSIQDVIVTLDVDYLKEAFVEMKDNHNRRDSMMILNPHPFTHTEQQDLESAKLLQLELLIKLAENIREIVKGEVALLSAKVNEKSLEKMFL